MDTLNAISTRISVRKYTDQPVTDEQVRALLNAAFCAPSACNKRPWEFVVVRDRDTLAKFAGKFRFQKMMTQAQLAIVVCGDNDRALDHDLMVNDCSAAVQNILLAAHAMGLGACWCGLSPSGVARRTAEWINAPENILPIATIAIGWPDESRQQPERYEPERVHYERFGGEEDNTKETK